MIHELKSFYVTSSFTKHLHYKNYLLELISKTKYESPVNKDCEVNITKTDWCHSRNFRRPWVHLIKDDLINDLNKMVVECNYEKIKVEDIWFQQYTNNSEHGWHTHSSNFTGVYYVDMPEGSPKTQIIEPYTNSVIELDLKEGDLVMFPSFTIHKAPKNLNNKTKTIISFNSNWSIFYTKENYTYPKNKWKKNFTQP